MNYSNNAAETGVKNNKSAYGFFPFDSRGENSTTSKVGETAQITLRNEDEHQLYARRQRYKLSCYLLIYLYETASV